MPQQKPWEKYSAGALPAPIPLTPAAPDYPYKGPKAAAEAARAQAEADPVLLKAQRDKAVAEARKAAAEAELADPTEAPVLAGKVNGEAFLKTLSPQDAAIAKGVADGRIAFPSGAALRSPYWQKVLTNVVNYDPQFDAINYNARAATRKDFTSGKSSMNIKALNTAIGHVGQLYDQISGTTSLGGDNNPIPGATLLNSLGNAYERSRGAKGITNYEQTAGSVASELTQVFRGTGGAEADVKRYLGELNSNASLDQKQGAVQNIMKLLKSRMDAIGDQYTKGMGTTAQPLKLLDDHAQKVFGAIMGQAGGSDGSIPPITGGAPPPGGPGGTLPGGIPPVGGGGPPQGPISPYSLAQGQYGDATNTEVAGATKSIPNELGIQFMKGLNSLFHAGASDERIRAYASQFGIDPSPQLAARAKIPGFRGSVPVTPGGLSITVPNESVISRVAGAIAGSPVATGIGEAGNSAAAGIPQWLAAQASGEPDLARARFGVARSMNPRAAITGDILGGTAGAIAGETGALKGATALGRALDLGEGAQNALNFGARRIADASYGGVSGATGADPGQAGNGALNGALAGTIGGLLGEGAGRYALEPATRPVARGMFGGAPKPSVADRILSKADTESIIPQLQEAQALNLPMTLADTDQGLRSLAGAAVRRSPNASGIAENVLIPRNRGQIDRFANAVGTDLGPIENIPQLQDNLIKTARAKAGPLYDQAYAAPPVSSPEVSSILNTPFGKSALGRAVDIAKNERVDPNALSVKFDAAGDPVLGPVPNMRTLDYAKRGMDDVLEQYRNPITGRLQLDEAGRAQNGVRADFLKEVDRINPTYAQARAAYAGPAAERDYINTGQDAFTANPDQLKFNLGQLPPDKAPMVQLGFRDALMQRANAARLSANPYDATLGTPAAEARLRAVYPEGSGPDTLLRRGQLERQMQNTSTDILGNSKTAQRLLADRDFGEGPLQLAIDLGASAAMGQAPIGTIAKVGTSQAIRDAIKFGVGKRAVAKADILAPTLLNPDPAASSDILTDALARSQGYRDYIARRRGMFGVPAGAIGAGVFSQ